MNKNQYFTGYLLMIACLFAFTTIEVIGVLIFQKGGTPLTLLTGRALLASIVFAILIPIFKKSFRIEKKDLFLLISAGLFLTFMLLSFWFGLKSLGHIGVHVSLYLLHPFFMIFLAIPLFKEKLTKKKLLSLVLGFGGVLFVLKLAPSFQLVNFEFSILGIFYSVMAGILMMGFMFCSQKLLQKYHFSQLLFYNYLIAFGIFLLFQNPILTVTQLSIPYILKAVLIIGIVSTCFAYALQQSAVKRIGATTCGIIKLAKPILTCIFAFLILSQTMTIFQILGGCSMMIGLYLIRKKDIQSKDNDMKLYIIPNFKETFNWYNALIDNIEKILQKGYLQDAFLLCKVKERLIYGSNTPSTCVDLKKAKVKGIPVSRAISPSGHGAGVMYLSGHTWVFEWYFSGNQKDCLKKEQVFKDIIKEFYKNLEIEIEIDKDVEVKGTNKKLGLYIFKNFPDKKFGYIITSFNLKKIRQDLNEFITLPKSKFADKSVKTIQERIITIPEITRELNDKEFVEHFEKVMKKLGIDYQKETKLPKEVLEIISKSSVKFESEEWIKKGRWSHVKDYGEKNDRRKT